MKSFGFWPFQDIETWICYFELFFKKVSFCSIMVVGAPQTLKGWQHCVRAGGLGHRGVTEGREGVCKFQNFCFITYEQPPSRTT